MEKQDHLPLFGVGPLYAAVVIFLTAGAVLCRDLPPLSAGRVTVLRIPLGAAGVVLIALGVWIWVAAVVFSKVDDNIRENRLVTTGVYAWVRNPIYCAFMMACTGVLLLAGNALFFALPLFYWLFMTVLMKSTEEKWLLKQYGDQYAQYCRRVNRCWPWFPQMNERR